MLPAPEKARLQRLQPETIIEPAKVLVVDATALTFNLFNTDLTSDSKRRNLRA